MGMLTNVFFFPEQKRQLCTANLSTPQEKKVLNNLQLPTAHAYVLCVGDSLCESEPAVFTLNEEWSVECPLKIHIQRFGLVAEGLDPCLLWRLVKISYRRTKAFEPMLRRHFIQSKHG